MRNLLFVFLAAFLLNSCVSATRIAEVEDQYKESNKMKLAFVPNAFCEETIEGIQSRTRYSVNSTYLFEQKKEGRPTLTLDIQLVTAVSNKELDSVLFLNLDGEKIKLTSSSYQYKEFDHSSSTTQNTRENEGTADKSATKEILQTTTTVSNHQLMNRIFVIPENLWISIARSKNVQYRIYLGDEGIDVIPTGAQNRKLNYFYEMAICKRDAKFPQVPEGQMKW